MKTTCALSASTCFSFRCAHSSTFFYLPTHDHESLQYETCHNCPSAHSWSYLENVYNEKFSGNLFTACLREPLSFFFSHPYADQLENHKQTSSSNKQLESGDEGESCGKKWSNKVAPGMKAEYVRSENTKTIKNELIKLGLVFFFFAARVRARPSIAKVERKRKQK